MNLSRRDVFRLLGAAGAGSLLPSVTGRSVARANAPAIPKRVVFFYTEQGTLKPFWAPKAPGAPEASTITTPWSTREHTLGELHQPLVGLKDKLTFLDGLDMRSAFVDPTPSANAHVAGETHALVGDGRQSSTLAGGMSIDQYIARAINSPAPVTSLPSLELFIHTWGGDAGYESQPLYSGPGEAIPLSGNAGSAYDRLFPDGPRGTTQADRDEAARRIVERQAVLQYAQKNFAAVSGKLGRVDRDRLAAHAAAMNDLANRLALGSNVTCREPSRNIVSGSGALQYEYNADVMMRLAQTALACDLTRVVTVYASVPHNELFGYRSVGGTTDFHDMIHSTNGPNPPLFGNPEAMKIVKDYHSYVASMYAKLLRLLDQIPEADGGTLLDHTLVVWCGQLAAGDHSLDRLPYVLGGRMGGLVTPGRYVRYPRTQVEGRPPEETVGLAHNDLFVSLANMMGVPASTFGNAQVCKGALGGLT